MTKIQIVEDDREVCEELKVFLENAGYEVFSIEDFKNVEDQILTNKPDLILLDINLPNVDGFTLCRRIRKSLDARIIFLTARDDVSDEYSGLMIGGDDYITKPYDLSVLLARISRVLHRNEDSQKKYIS